MKNIASIFCCAMLAAPLLTQNRPAAVPQDRWQQAVQLARLGRRRESLGEFKRLLAGSADENVLRNAGLALQTAGASAEAEALFLWAREKVKKRIAFAPELADLYQSQLQYHEAVREWSLLLESGWGAAVAGLDAIGAQAGYRAVAIWMGNEKYGSDGFLKVSGGMWEKAGDPDKAWRSFSRVHDDRVAGVLLNALLDQPGVTARQESSYIGEYVSRKPADQGVWELRLAGSLTEAGDPERAERLLATLAARGNVPARLMHARLLLVERHRPDESRAELSVSGAWPDPVRTEARFLEAAALIAQAKWDSATAVLSPLSEPGRDSATRQRALYQLAEIDFLLERFDDAAAHYAQVAALGPGGDMVNDALARMLLISSTKTDKMELLRALAGVRARQAQFLLREADQGFETLAGRAAGTAIADEARLGRAEMAEGLRDFRRAETLFIEIEQGTADTTLAAEALYRAGKIAAERLDDQARARRTWERGILKYPDTSWADLMRGGLERMKAARQP